MTHFSRGALVALCIGTALYVASVPFLDPAPYALAYAFAGIVGATVIEWLISRRR